MNQRKRRELLDNATGLVIFDFIFTLFVAMLIIAAVILYATM